MFGEEEWRELTDEISGKNTNNRGRRYRGIAEHVTRDAIERPRDERHEPCHSDAGGIGKSSSNPLSVRDSLKNPPIQPSSAGKEDPDGRDENSPEPSNPHVKEGTAKRQDAYHEGKCEREKQSGEFSVDGPRL